MSALVEKKTGFEGSRTLIHGGFCAWWRAGSIFAQDIGRRFKCECPSCKSSTLGAAELTSFDLLSRAQAVPRRKCTFATVLFLAVTRLASSQTIWTGQTGDWFDATNWSDGVPDSSHDAQITNGGTADIAAGTAEVNNVFLAFDAANSGNLIVSDSAGLQAAGQLVVGALGTASLTIQNGATVTDEIGAIAQSANNSAGTALVEGVGSNWTNDSLFVGEFGLGALMILDGGTVFTLGADVASNPTASGQVLVDGPGSQLEVSGPLFVGGAYSIDGAIPGGIASIQITNGGSLSSGETIVLGRATLTDNGILYTDLMIMFSGGLLLGNGTVSGDVTGGGEIAPGDPFGTLLINGNFIHDPAGKFVFSISGTAPDSQSHLSILGDMTADAIQGATVEVRFTDGFLPTLGDVFELIDISGIQSGSFRQLTFPDLRFGFQFNAQWVNGVYQLTAMSDGAPAIGLRNISTRGQVAPGDDALIAGFIVTGTRDKQVIIRGLGPSLANNGLPLSGLLADPMLELRDNTRTLISSNDNWMDSPDRQAIIDSTIPPTDDHEAAIVATLAPGNYTAILRGVGDGSGIGIVEVYDLSPDPDATLANLSTRGVVDTANEVMIGGFITDDQNTNVLLRALGPSLTANGVENALADPFIEVHNSDGELIASNNDWRDTDTANIQNTGIPPIFDEESALIVTLGPGNFTAVIQGEEGGSGVGLLEIYNLK